MYIAVRTPDGLREVECDIMADFGESIVREWFGSVEGTMSATQSDAVEFCESVAVKWADYRKRRRIARSLDELLDRSSRNPEEESLGVLAARADWYGGGQVLAICEFRRTWSNNIVFDFLAVRPDLLVGRPLPISGLGTCLLWRLSRIALSLNVETVWAETTATSVGYYSNALGRRDFKDLLIMSRAEFCDRFGVRN